MDEEKKPDASGEETERLGPYLLQEQVEQSDDSQVELYLATHETSGAKALVRKHAAEEGAAAPKDWRVLLGFWASRGYSAMEVEYTAWARAQDRQSAESLLLTLESVLEEVRRMARAVSDTHKPRLRWRLGLTLSSAAVVCVPLFALVRLALVSSPPSGTEPLANTPPASMSQEVSTADEAPDPFSSGWLSDTADARASVVTRPLPSGPFKGQKRPPCKRYSEVELVGGCWMEHALKAPCPEELYEYQGKCYVPGFSAAKPLPQSIGQ